MAHEIFVLLGEYGLLLVFLNVLVTQLGMPLPAVPTLVVAGALTASGQLALPAVLLVAVLACLIGDTLWYGAGRRYGGHVMRALCRISLAPDSCVHRSELQFQRWRGRVLLIAKFVPGLSTVAPPLVGAMGLGFLSFILFDSIGSLLWAGVAVVLGNAFAAQLDMLLGLLADAGSLALALLLGLLALYILVRWWQRHRLLAALRMPRIGAAELNQALARGQAPLVLDVRSVPARALDRRVVPGALLADEQQMDELIRDISPDRELVLYCNCPHEATAAKAAKALKARGYRHVRPLAGGLDAWAAAGYAVDRLPERPTAEAARVHAAGA
ncbi:MAG TPA: VTT domain-containing protein [Rhodanobacter sp.]|jgi:membrane protein DedA with SNARE-associated domain/rhodanese-related sulfurtransferase|nr:VTT domain-containing protein [Rhodanobacter sp.]